ncbi:MAG: hypothetical protein RMJ97_05320 [Raineya sp.]|nr:hypothetical protein [Raineya sp.]MDW8296289.1 hypothetical protein [Raineya sp.]
MKIVDIFAVVEGSLYAAQFGEELNEFEKLRRNWQDAEFVKNYFEQRTTSLRYFHISLEEGQSKVLEESEGLFNRILKTAQGKTKLDLDAIFRPLNDNEFAITDFQKSKYKEYFFRIYAVRVDKNLYVISGGGIKLVKTMQEDTDLTKELIKIECLRNYLIEQSLYE